MSREMNVARRVSPAAPWAFAARGLLCAACLLLLTIEPLRAETGELRIGSGFGIHYLPFYVMDQQHLVEKYAKAAGMPVLKASYVQFSGGASLNDAVLSGAVDVVGAGVGPFAILWDKTKGNLNIKAIAGMGDIPLTLLTNNPNIHDLKDIKDGDRIALPAVKASMQATLLQMAAAKTFGEANYKALDQYTVTFPHSDAATAMLSHNGIIDLHFSVAPYATRELEDPKIHEITETSKIMGGPMSLNLTFMTERFHDNNPTVCRIYLEALSEAMDFIAKNPDAAAAIYLKGDKGAPATLSMVEAVLKDPAFHYTVVPHGVGSVTAFMHTSGLLKNDPGSWNNLFFSEAQGFAGN